VPTPGHAQVTPAEERLKALQIQVFIAPDSPPDSGPIFLLLGAESAIFFVSIPTLPSVIRAHS